MAAIAQCPVCGETRLPGWDVCPACGRPYPDDPDMNVRHGRLQNVHARPLASTAHDLHNGNCSTPFRGRAFFVSRKGFH